MLEFVIISLAFNKNDDWQYNFWARNPIKRKGDKTPKCPPINVISRYETRRVLFDYLICKILNYYKFI